MKVFFLNRNLLKESIQEAVRNLTIEHGEILEVILFGSVAQDRALPSSDIDLLIVVKKSDERFIDRSSRYLPYFDSIPLGIDCFVYTREEIERGNIPIVHAALNHGIELYPGCR